MIRNQKKRDISKPTQKKKRLQEFYRNLSEDEKLIKEIILTIEIKILQM